MTAADSPSFSGTVVSQRQTSPGALLLQLQGRGSFIHDSRRSLLPTMSRIVLKREEPIAYSERYPFTPLFQTPALSPFGWWASFAGFNQLIFPALSYDHLSSSIWQLLAPLGQRLNNYEDECKFKDIANSCKERTKCSGCRATAIAAVLLAISIYEGDLQKVERFIGASIQFMAEWNELSDFDVIKPASLIGATLCQLGRYREAVPLLTEAADSWRANDKKLAAIRVELAACYKGLNQRNEPEGQLGKVLGPQLGRLAIITTSSRPDFSPCYECIINALSQGTTERKLVDGPSNLWPNSLLVIGFETESAQLELPAGTSPSKNGVVPLLDNEQLSGFSPDMPLSTAWLYMSEVVVLLRAVSGEVVGELHRRMLGIDDSQHTTRVEDLLQYYRVRG